MQYQTDHHLNSRSKTYTLIDRSGTGQWRFNLASDQTLATRSDSILSIDIEPRPEEGHDVAWMGTQSGTILRLQLADEGAGRPQGKLKIIEGAAHANQQIIKVPSRFLHIFLGLARRVLGGLFLGFGFS